MGFFSKKNWDFTVIDIPSSIFSILYCLRLRNICLGCLSDSRKNIHFVYTDSCSITSMLDNYTVYDGTITGFYREIAIAIQDEVGDSNGGNVQYVTMLITFNIPAIYA